MQLQTDLPLYRFRFPLTKACEQNQKRLKHYRYIWVLLSSYFLHQQNLSTILREINVPEKWVKTEKL